MKMYPHKGAFPAIAGAPNLVTSTVPMVGDSQWMSQSAYQNIDLDKVDWAALAQQWIHMKESCGVVSDDLIPNAPPPPRLSSVLTDYEEKGEAPMEVEHEEEQTSQTNENTANVTAPPPPTNIFQTNNWNSEQNSRGHHQKQWNRSNLNGITKSNNPANRLLTSEGNRWSSSNSNHSKSQRIPPNDGYAPGQVFNNAKPSSAWSSSGSSSQMTNAPPFAAAANSASDLRPKGLDANSKSGIQLEQVGLNATPPLDAAQRKTLPAWIR